MVIATARIETRSAVGAGIPGRQIGRDRKLGASHTAKHGQRVEFIARPRLQMVIREHVVTVLARVVLATAPELDGYDVQLAPIMRAPGLRIDVESQYGRSRRLVAAAVGCGQFSDRLLRRVGWRGLTESY